MDAYEIRLELLKMSRDILMEDWSRRNSAVEYQYFQQREIAMRAEHNPEFVPYPTMPAAPTSSEITELARSFKDFVSSKS
jgi:hypothetical protein